MNDAVSIVLYRTIISGTQQENTFKHVIQTGLNFTKVIFGSIIVGAGLAFISALIIKKQKKSLKQGMTKVEISLMTICPWICYLVGESCELSGIFAILCNGIFLAHYAAPNLNE